jgi:integrase
MASISRRNGKWRVRWRDPDGKARSRQCPTKRAAQELQAQVEEACALGVRWEPYGEPRDAREEPDLRLLLRDYVDECTRVLQPSTAMRYARILDVFLRFMDTQHGEGTPLPPSLLTRRLLADWYEDLATGGLHGNPRSQATRRKAVEVLQLAWAWLYDNDESAVTIPPPRRLRMARQPAARTVAPTWEEMDACLAALNGWHRDLATVLRFTGLRVQQVMGLRWGDLDPRSGQLIIRGELGKSPQERRGREIPISDHLATELDRWERSDEGWLIVSKRQRGAGRERMARARDVGRAWKRAGVREEAWRGRPHHAFRNGFVSGLGREGADPDALPLREAVVLVPPLTIELPVRQPRFEGLGPRDLHPRQRRPGRVRSKGWWGRRDSNPHIRTDSGF